MFQRLWSEDEGVLTFEWIVLLTLLVIGVIGGIAGIRDAIIHESQGTVGSMVSLDQTYFATFPLAVSVQPLSGVGTAGCTSSATYSSFGDDAVYASARLTTADLQSHVQTLPN